MDKGWICVMVSLWLSACSGGSGSDDSVEPAVYYAEPVVVVNSYAHDEQHITSIYYSVADCMGYEALELPVVYVVDDLSSIWPDVPDNANGFTRSVGGFVDIFVLELNDGTLSHEFVHYILYKNNDASIYNKEHLSDYFVDCRQ